jgi:hypothetical protein
MKFFALLLVLISFASHAQKIPKNAHKVKNLWGWECDKGYIHQKDRCEKVKLPKHSYLNEDGHTWSCKTGYVKYRGECRKDKK